MTRQKTTGIAESLADYLEDWVRAGVTDLAPANLPAESRTPPVPPPAETSAKAANLGIQSPLKDETSSQETIQPSPLELPQNGVEEKEISSEMASPLDRIVKKIVPDASGPERAALLQELAVVVSKCSKCPELVANRTQTVFGVGNPQAELVFIGEGPGADEDRQGVPFVGRSGQLLTDIIVKGMKMSREEVYICNIVRCRPPGNRNPTGVEAECCRPFLDATLAVLNPKYICCLGAIAATNLLHTSDPIGRLRGRVLDYLGAKVICTYHPAYLLRNPPAKAQAWEDIKLLLRTMGRPIR